MLQSKGEPPFGAFESIRRFKPYVYPMNLVIVESPPKAKTISRFLGSDFVVASSYGHVRDLPKSKLGVDVEHDFAPQYIITTRAKKIWRS